MQLINSLINNSGREIALIEIQHYDKLKKGFEDLVAKTNDIPQSIIDISRIEDKVDKVNK